MSKAAPLTGNHDLALVSITTSVPRETFLAFTARAEQRDLTRSALMRQLVLDEIAKGEEK